MSNNKGFSRRNFLRNTALGIVGTGVATTGRVFGEQTEKKEPEPIKIKAFRTLGRTGFKASDISSGGPSNGAVLNALLDAGVNYIDTAESYSRGESEIVTGKAIKNRDRKSLFITSKLHINENESKESILNRARKCLERLDTDYLDCMMMHNAPTIKSIKYEPFHEAMKVLKNEGRLRYIGISNHGTTHGADDKIDSMEQVLLAAAADGRFDVMLLVHNFIQKEMGEKILKACKEKNIGATLMKTNPVGRYLNMKDRIETEEKAGKEVSQRMREAFDSLKKTAELGDAFVKKYDLKDSVEIRAAATQFCLSDPNVTAVLARCATFEDVEHFVKLSGTNLENLQAKKLDAFKNGPGKLYCRHACGICESSCAKKVPVSTIMRYNHYFDAQGQEKYAMEKYAALQTNKADLCINCDGACQVACPYGVPVQGLLALAHGRLILA